MFPLWVYQLNLLTYHRDFFKILLHYNMDVEFWRTGQKRLEAVKSFVAQLYIRRGDLMKELGRIETVKGADEEIRKMET
jgi:hypothetical protein